MDASQLRGWAHRHRWALAFVAVVVAGYALGKDAAMRDNRADRAQVSEVRG